MEKHRCADCNNNKIVVAQDEKNPKCEYRLINNSAKRVCKVTVDGCYITEGKRCDFLLIDCDSKVAFFIELKGRHLLEAVEQIYETINRFWQQMNGVIINGRIVLTKVTVPNLRNNPNILRLEKKLKSVNGTLEYKTIKMNEII
ncbi:MAG TPA: hypothetical protein VJL89_04545 [Thermodesulfovibrionia bacterium]|nr:hypothetical protein [Thermodesulfovibrionia bacterium]